MDKVYYRIFLSFLSNILGDNYVTIVEIEYTMNMANCKNIENVFSCQNQLKGRYQWFNLYVLEIYYIKL